MTQTEIIALHNEIFDFLYQKYLDEKEVGREFYFFLSAEKDFIIASFWDTREAYLNFDLVIDTKTSFVYLVASGNNRVMVADDDNEFKERVKKIEQLKTKINQAIGEIVAGETYDKRFLPMRSLITEVSLDKAMQKYDSSDLIENLIHFLEKDKPLIDNYLKENNYNWFWKERIFANYVKKVRQTQADSRKKTYIQGLPICLRSLSVKNYKDKAIQDLEIEDVPSNTRWVFLTGENGIGKTLVLEAIALGLKAADWEKGSKERDKCMIEAQYQTPLLSVVCALNQQIIPNLYISPPSDIPVVAYSCNRLNEVENTISTMAIGHLFGKTSLINVDNWLTTLLKKIDSEENRKRQGIEIDETQLSKDQNTFQALLTTFKKIFRIYDIVLHSEKESVLYKEQDEQGEIISAVPFSQLSAGYRSLLSLMSDMIVRLSHERMPEILDNYFIKDPKELIGIVIIDEFENHLHAKLQRKLVEIMTNLFPKVQFIVSTHSPIPLLGAPKESVILHVERSKEEGITLKRLDDIIPFKDLLPNAILSSPIFGLYNLIPNDRDTDKLLANPNDYQEVFFEEMLNEKLRKFREESDFDFEKFKKA